MRPYDRHSSRHHDAYRFRDLDEPGASWERAPRRRVVHEDLASFGRVPSWSGVGAGHGGDFGEARGPMHATPKRPTSRLVGSWRSTMRTVERWADRLQGSRREMVARLRAAVAVVRTGDVTEASKFRLDRQIQEDVHARFARSHDLDARRLTVTVRAGIVTLEGSVPDRRSRYVAENLLEDVLGVRDVTNLLHVEREAQARDVSR